MAVAVTVAAGPALKPTKAPSVSGTAKVGRELTANHGTGAVTVCRRSAGFLGPVPGLFPRWGIPALRRG
ncbi:hypothetical protein [Streptomyces antibioticus]|uniref:hypothetical protein n=1 Tax=Streptomyces antibioticus TaxID=1890 RepID=UPI00340EE311